MRIKKTIRSLLPEWLLQLYHYTLARLAAVVYGHPSDELIVIGVTGTNGKSTTVNFIGRMLEEVGETVGWTTTANFKVADKEWQNDKKMTMLGRFQTQKMLSDMVEAGCRYAIVETSSQGIAQFRHIAINYDVAVFTNLTPEHIEAHGGFENYKKAKGKLFAHTANGKPKHFDGVEVPKVSVINIDDEHAPYFLSFPVDKKIGYGLDMGEEREPLPSRILREQFHPIVAKDLDFQADGTEFSVNGVHMQLSQAGHFNAYNAMAAVGALRGLNYSWNEIRDAVSGITTVPGRLEAVDAGQPFGVIVDYAHEPAALSALYEAISLMPYKRIIHVLGSAGGGRDVARRPKLGKLAGERADIVVVTNEDPYDEDPMKIIDQVADGAVAVGKKDDVDLFRIEDRQEAIEQAVAAANENDLVLITGKGCEPVMAVAGGKKVPWDDREVARKAIKKYYEGNGE
jgi:UDP-N-acetylmuramoyl-L-alanyl-D-glutamate--2,6-diaminopimelate ligase